MMPGCQAAIPIAIPTPMITRDNEDDGQVDRQPLGLSLAGCSFTGRILHTPFWVRKNLV